MGVANYNLAKYDAALSFLTRALAMRQALFAADHPDVVLSLQAVKETKRQLAKQVGGGGEVRGDAASGVGCLWKCNGACRGGGWQGTYETRVCCLGC